MSHRPLRLLTVCSHNRTRSVMMAALLDSMLTDRVGSGAVVVRSSGFGPAGVPPIDDAVDAMARRGLDVSGHLSRDTTLALVDGADVIVTAERDHVVRVAALSPRAFPKAMTLPELIERSAGVEAPTHGVAQWVQAMTADRGTQAYLRADVPEIADPTGTAPRVFERAVADIEQQCGHVADLLAIALGSPVDHDPMV